MEVGATIGAYQVIAKLGEGGMGEVYRATDGNLKRSVAIKVLPASVAGDADRLARFQREAEVLAALNHPNIGAIYGLEKTPDFTALVMELVDGDDLSSRIARGAIPIDEALPIAQADRGRARRRARAGHHPPRSQAREHQDPRRRHGESPRLRPGQGDGPVPARRAPMRSTPRRSRRTRHRWA